MRMQCLDYHRPECRHEQNWRGGRSPSCLISAGCGGSPRVFRAWLSAWPSPSRPRIISRAGALAIDSLGNRVARRRHEATAVWAGGLPRWRPRVVPLRVIAAQYPGRAQHGHDRCGRRKHTEVFHCVPPKFGIIRLMVTDCGSPSIDMSQMRHRYWRATVEIQLMIIGKIR